VPDLDADDAAAGLRNRTLIEPPDAPFGHGHAISAVVIGPCPPPRKREALARTSFDDEE